MTLIVSVRPRKDVVWLMVEAIGNRYDGNKGRDLTTPSSNVDDGVCANHFFGLTWSAHNSFLDASDM